jgi:hypothetical protein
MALLHTWLRRLPFVAVLALGFSSLNSGRAHAATPSFLRPATRPISFMAGLGPTFEITHRDVPDGFVFDHAMMFHFKKDASGPALGFELLFENLDDDIFGLQTGLKFEYDIQIVRNLAIYVSPGGSVGYHGFFWEDRFDDDHSSHAIYIKPAVTGKVIFDNRWMVWLSPIGHDFIFGGPWDDDFAMRWNVRLGAGVIF